MNQAVYKQVMMSRLTRTILLPLLGISVICIGSVESVYYWFNHYVEQQTRIIGKGKPGRTDAAAPVPAGVTKANGRLDDYSVIIERNLFSSSIEAEIDARARDPLEGVEASSLDVVLMGTISGTDDDVRAIIYDKSEKKQELYQVGDYIQQAVIKQILRGKVILNYNGRDEMLDISEARNVAVPRVASVNPIVVKQRVTGRPIGQPAADAGQGSVTPPDSPAGMEGTTDSNIRRPLRSFKGGLKVKGESAAELPAGDAGDAGEPAAE